MPTAERRWSAPGRVNLIGEHTDYVGGLALPFALQLRTRVRATARGDGRVRVVSDGHGEAELPLAPGSGAVSGWAAYPAGVARVLHEEGLAPAGADLRVRSEVPAGAGLSSSHALEVAVGLALLDLAGHDVDTPGAALDRSGLARLVQRAEHDHVGAPTGLMDQLAILHGRAGHAVLVDARSGSAAPVPCDPDAAGLRLLVIDTGVAHALADGGYADRRDACLAAEAALGAGLREVSDLDEPLAAVLARLAAGVPDPVARRRARHVVTENRRVRAAVAALRAGELAALGPLLSASHRSLRDDHAVSAPELDAAVEAAQGAGALGSRMVGGGFGGSALALVPAARRDAVVDAVRARFAAAGWAEPAFLDAEPSAPAGRDG